MGQIRQMDWTGLDEGAGTKWVKCNMHAARVVMCLDWHSKQVVDIYVKQAKPYEQHCPFEWVGSTS